MDTFVEEVSLEQVAQKVAQIYAKRNWHKLTLDEKELIVMLEHLGCLTVNNPPNGFVGKSIIPAS